MWYALRVTYGRELKFQTMLKNAGFETFVPMKKKKVEKEEEVVVVEEAPKACSVCGYQGESKFCPQCGAPMEAPAAEEAPVEEAPAAE